MQGPPDSPVTPCTSPSISPTSEVNCETKKRPLEKDDSDEVDSDKDSNREKTATKSKKFYNHREKIDRETEDRTDRATILFNKMKRSTEGSKEPGPQSWNSQISLHNTTPNKYENMKTKSTSASKFGLSSSLQGSGPSAIPPKLKTVDNFYGSQGTSKYLSYHNKSPYFQKSPSSIFKKSKIPSLLSNEFLPKRSSMSGNRSALSPLSINHSSNKIGASTCYNSLITSDTQKLNGNDENCPFKEDDNPFLSHEKVDVKSDDETELEVDTIVLPHKIGFRNFGNTCYMNSTIQILLGLKPFCWDVKAELSAMSVHLAALQAVIQFADQGKQDSAMGALKMLRGNFINHINSEFKGFKQQDASEFFALFITHIDEDITKVRNKYFKKMYKEGSKTLIGDNFEVCMTEKNTCKHCEKVREDKQQNLQLFVSLPEKEEKDEFTSVKPISTSSIQSLLEEQVLGSHQNKCSNCESEEGCCTTRLTTLPRILLVQLKRYNNKSEKIKTPIKISPFLVLDKFVADNCVGPKPIRVLHENKVTQTGESSEEDEEIKRVLELSLQESISEENDYKKAMVQSLLDDVSSENWSEDDAKNIWAAPCNVKHCYRLVGVMLHGGEGTGQGHYSAHVYRSDVHKWMYYSDSYLHDLHTKEIFELRTQKDCYLLAYMHKDIFDATELHV